MPAQPLSADPLDIMLAHDAWATRLLLTHCRPLTHEQFHRRFEMGLGTLHLTFTHIISATRRWTDRLASRTLRPPLHAIDDQPNVAADAKDRAIDELLALHDAASADLREVAAACRARSLHTILQLNWPADGRMKRYTFSHGAVLVHVTTHAVHHRAQILNMLRHLNVPGVSDRLPDPSAVDWQAEAESPPEMI